VAELTQEQFDQLPDFVKGDYEKAGEVYIPVAEGKMRAMKGTLNDLDSKYKQANSRIEEIERSKAQEIENAKAEALKTARSKGDVEAIEKRYQEQMADLEKRTKQQVESLTERLTKREQESKQDKRARILSELADSLGVHKKAFSLFEDKVMKKIDFDIDNNKPIFLDGAGGATSLDIKGFLSELEKDESLDFIREKKLATGGLANGNNGGKGGAETAKTEAQKTAESAKKNGDLGGFLNAKLSSVGVKNA